MRYHTKEYYTLMMALGAADSYEPVVDKEYTEEDIKELYQKALDKYIEEERAEYDEPPELFVDEDEDEEDLEDFDPEDYTFLVAEYTDDEEEPELITRHPSSLDELRELKMQIIDYALSAYENRPPFDEEEAREDFEEMYNDNLEEPDEDLPEWVRESVDSRILAMWFLPEKIYRKLSAEDEANEKRFEELDERADEALEELREALPDEYADIMDVLEDLESADVMEAKTGSGDIELTVLGWSDEGDDELRLLKFTDAELIEDEGLVVRAWEDEDGDPESDCELLYSEIYKEGGRPEVHMLFDNNGLKYLTFRCSEVHAYRVRRGRNKEIAAIV